VSIPVIETAKLNLELTSGKSRLHVLKDVDMRVNAGEVVAVVGPSGSGKTSLLMVLSGLEKPTSGKVAVAGHDITALDEDELAVFRRRNLGILFQNFHLVPSMTAMENVALALEIAETDRSLGEIRSEAERALVEVGLGDRLTHLPSALSGGEQQRVGLARAMVTGPGLILADEPTGNLDQNTGAKVIAMMFELAREKGTSAVLITHDASIAERADRIMTMNLGRLSDGQAEAAE
jgi:putative ABC transport system ATP-binding protein